MLSDAEGAAIGATPPMLAWDSSSVDADGIPTDTIVLDTELTQTGASGSDAARVVSHELTVTPPAGFLGGTDGEGAGVEYPVVLDPQVEFLNLIQDTWVRGDVYGGNGSDTKLLVGPNPTSGTNGSLSFLHFDHTSFAGRQVDRAELGLYQYYAASCSPREMYAHSVNGTWTETNMGWTTQPGVHPTGFASITANRGAGCATTQGITAVDITPIARDWSTGARINRGVRLAAPAAGNASFERRFCSKDFNASFATTCAVTAKPYLKVTYHPTLAGERAGASQLSFTAGDSVGAKIDVATGNLLVTVDGINLPGMNAPVGIGATYNSFAGGVERRLGRGWNLENTTDTRVTPDAGPASTRPVTLTGPGGRTDEFTVADSASDGTVTYDEPKGMKADLVRTPAGTYELKMRESEAKYFFGADGALVSANDRNGNATTITPSGSATWKNLSIQSPSGAPNARVAKVTTNASGTTTITQGATTTVRTTSFARTGDLATSFTDARGRTTTFTYGAEGLMTQISAPGNVVTQFGYDDRRRVNKITQVENASGGPGNSVTRLEFTSRNETVVASPITNQSAAVTSVPRTTFTLDNNFRVTKVVDAAGRERSKSYTPNFDTATSTVGAAGGAGTTGGGSITTNTWDGNDGDSMTESQAPTGATSSAAYEGTGQSAYNPTSSTDDGGRTSTYGYNGSGNQLSSTDASGAESEVTRNPDGTVETATSPGNGTNSTTYGYTNRQVTAITPVTGSSLGAKAYTYDTMGRVATMTNGRGITTTYAYNPNDQVTSLTFTGTGIATSSVTYGYNTAGRQNSRVDAHGTTTMVYDQLGRMTSRQNTAGGGAITYTYDKDSRLTSSVSSTGGTINYTYDASGVPTGVEYPTTGTARAAMRFTTDEKGRRTNTYLAANSAVTTWAARSTNHYDDSGRVTRVVADRGNGTPSVIDVTYCYTAGTTPASGCTTNPANDRGKLEWKKDNVSNATVTYTYDDSGRLTDTNPSAGVPYAYDYNDAGARTSATTGSSTQTLTFNAAHQITTSGYAYDGAGNLTADPSSGTTNITYTSADQLNSVVKSGTTYTYKHAGADNNELLEQTSPDGTYKYTYGRNAASGVPIVEQVQRTTTTGATTTTANASIISDPTTGTPLMLKTSASQQSMYVYDGTPGAPIALLSEASTTPAAYSYDPYGAVVITAGANPQVVTESPYTFGGNGVRDRTTDWVHYGERYYSTVTGTFTQQDSLDAPLSALNANRYAYAGGDPINNTDPTGRDAGCTTVAFLAGGYAAAGGSVAGPRGAQTAGTFVGGFVNGACTSDGETPGARLRDGFDGGFRTAADYGSSLGMAYWVADNLL